MLYKVLFIPLHSSSLLYYLSSSFFFHLFILYLLAYFYRFIVFDSDILIFFLLIIIILLSSHYYSCYFSDSSSISPHYIGFTLILLHFILFLSINDFMLDHILIDFSIRMFFIDLLTINGNDMIDVGKEKILKEEKRKNGYNIYHYSNTSIRHLTSTKNITNKSFNHR